MISQLRKYFLDWLHLQHVKWWLRLRYSPKARAQLLGLRRERLRL
jgi:hypothetical protein